MLSGGIIRRPALVLKNAEGKYDHIAIYKSKKATEPMVTIQNREYVRDIVDDCVKGDDMIKATRDMRVLERPSMSILHPGSERIYPDNGLSVCKFPA